MALLSTAAVILACSAPSQTALGPLTKDVQSAAPDVVDACRLAEIKCSRCHTIDRVKDLRPKSPLHWQHYVTRMRLQPRSAISPKDGETIVRCLVFRSFGKKGLDSLANDRRSKP